MIRPPGMQKAFTSLPSMTLTSHLQFGASGRNVWVCGMMRLATAYDDHALYNGRARQPTPGPGIHQPILWTTEYGKGRVFNTALGHDGENVKQLPFAVTFARGAEWAAKGVVTLPIPTEMAR